MLMYMSTFTYFSFHFFSFLFIHCGHYWDSLPLANLISFSFLEILSLLQISSFSYMRIYFHFYTNGHIWDFYLFFLISYFITQLPPHFSHECNMYVYALCMHFIFSLFHIPPQLVSIFNIILILIIILDIYITSISKQL